MAQIYDVVNFDMVLMLRLPAPAAAAEWIYSRGDAQVPAIIFAKL